MSYVRGSSTEPQSSSEEPERQPRKGDKTGQDPRTTRSYAGSVRTQENVRSLHFRTRKGQSCNPLKAETDKPWPGAGEASMQFERDVAWSNTRTATPKTEASTSRPGEGWGRESEAPWSYTSSPYREVRLPEVPLASQHAWKTRAGNAPVKRITVRPPKQTDPPGEGERQQGQKKKGQDPLLWWLEGYTQSPRQKRRQLNVEPSPLHSRLADQRMTNRHPEDGPEKKLSQEPNCSNSFNRDQIARTWPHCRRCGIVTARENLTTPLDLIGSQCACARVWTAGTVRPTNRGAEETHHLYPNNPERRRRINHAQLCSERLETKEHGACRQFQTRQGLGGRAVTWQRTAKPKTKRNAQISCQGQR